MTGEIDAGTGVIQGMNGKRPAEKCGMSGENMILCADCFPERDEQAHRKNLDGTLTFELGSIAIHILSSSFVEQLNAKGCGLPLHRAVKKIAYIDERGNPIQPDKPNAVKLETFIFDALPLANKSIILEILRSEEFAPVKNASGADSPEVTHRMMIATIEIAPSFALGPEDIAAKLDRIPPLSPGESVYLE